MPTSDEILARRQHLSADQLDRLDRRLRGERAPGAPVGITRRGLVEAPLSYCQQGRRFLVQLMGGQALYFNHRGRHRIRGPLDVSALERALGEIEVRHEVLRTTFGGGWPEMQHIHPPQPFSLPRVDLTDVAPEEREAEAHRAVTEAALEPIDNATGPVWRAHLFRLADDDHVLLIIIDHLVADPWSLVVLRRELFTLYSAFSQGLPSPLPPLAVQYADYAVWEREWLEGTEMQRQVDYWTGQLAGLKSLQLPGERPPGRSWSTTGLNEPFTLDREMSAAVRALGRELQVTPAMILLATFKTLIALEAERDNVALATFNLNRSRPETEPLIGLFVNILLLRTDLSGDPTFATVLERERAVVLGALSHSSLPGDQLISIPGALDAINRDKQDWIVYHFFTLSSSEVELPGLEVGPFEVGSDDPEEEFPTGPIDLHLLMEEVDGAFTGSISYNIELFDRATICAMLDRFRRVLATGLADPGRRLHSLLD
jgi:hypothetical protein